MTLPPRSVLLGLGAGLVLVVALVSGLTRDDDDPAVLIRAALDRAAAAAEARDVGGVMALISASFATPELSHDDVRRALFVRLRQDQGWRKVVLTDVDIRVDDGGARAKVTLRALLAKGESKDGTWRDLAPSDATVYDFDLVFRREGEDWRVTEALYTRAKWP